MIAVDTNVVVRLLTGDHAGQTKEARALFDSGPVWIAKIVVLETAWVLGKLYGFDNTEVSIALRKLIGLPNVRAEDEQAVIDALAMTDQGIDFADALHLSSRPRHVAFHSFDGKFVRRAMRAGVEGVVLALKS